MAPVEISTDVVGKAPSAMSLKESSAHVYDVRCL